MHSSVTSCNRILSRNARRFLRRNAKEKKLSEMCTKVLSGAVSEFGDDSDEYEQLGGTRKSDRKKPVRKPKAI